MTSVSKIIKMLRKRKDSKKKKPVLRTKQKATSYGGTIRRQSVEWRRSLTSACQAFDGFESCASEYGWELHKSELNRVRDEICAQKKILDELQNEAAYLRLLRNQLRSSYYSSNKSVN